MFSCGSFGISPLVSSPTLPEIMLWRTLLWRQILHVYRNQLHTYYLVWFFWIPKFEVNTVWSCRFGRSAYLQLSLLFTTGASSFSSSSSCPPIWIPFFLWASLMAVLVILYSRIFLDHLSSDKRLRLPNHVIWFVV